MKLSAILHQNKNGDVQRLELPTVSDKHSVITYEPQHTGQPVFDIFAIVDPASYDAQKIAPLVNVSL